MKKILNYASLFIIAIVFGFGLSLNVSAENACSNYKNGFNECRIGERGTIVVAGNGWKYRSLSSSETTKTTRKIVSATGEKTAKGNPTNYYKTVGITYTVNNKVPTSYFTSYEDSQSALFCMDAQYEGGPNLKAERFLLDTSESIKVQAFDAAAMSVLTSGGTLENVSNIQDYWARNMAIRALTYTFGFYNDTSIAYTGAFYAGLSTANSWISKASSEISALNAALSAAGSTGSVGGVPAHAGYSFSGGPVDTAYNYYVNALKEAAEYVSTLSTQTSVQNISITPEDVESTGDSDNLFVQKDVVHVIKLTGFNQENAKFSLEKGENNGVKFAEGTQYEGLTAYISKIEIDGQSVDVDTAFNSDWVESGWITKDEVTVTITVHFEGWKTSTDPNQALLKCGQQPIKYSIDGLFSAAGSNKFSDYVAVVWYSGESKKQRYLGVEKLVEKDDAGTPWTSPNSEGTYLIDACSCEDLVKACTDSGNINSDECEELRESNCGECSYIKAACDIDPNSSACDEEKYAEVCDITCETDFTTFECCDEAGDLIVSTLDDKEVSILGPGPDNTKSDDIKACFVSKVDAQCKGSDPDNNSCAGAEGVKDQKENTYTLKDLQDNKYCTVSCKEDYIMTMPTAKLVNAGRYFTFKAKIEGTKTCYTNTIDREQYNKDVVNAQVEMVNAYSNYLYWKSLYGLTPVSETASDSYSSCCWESDGEGGGSCTCPCDVETSWLEYHVESTYVKHYVKDNQKNYSNGTISISTVNDGSYDGNDGHVDGSCSYCSCTPGVDGKAQTVIDDVNYNYEQARERLRQAGEAYKEILKAYDDCSTWESEINYDPEVYYDYEEDYMNLLTNHIGEMDEDKSTSDASDWYCNSRIASGSGAESTKGQLSDKNYEQCNTNSTGYHETSINYVYCDESGCKITPELVSDARYKKVSSGVTANYKPKTLFYNVYPTGEITVNEADDNVALENKLPVALDTERGIYKYTVNVEKLGEFYHMDPTDNLGRYVGSSTAVVDLTKLVYNCAYLVNIQITDGWVCDFNDTCTDDCIVNCKGPNCDDNICEGDECVADCIGIGCIYDSGAGSSLLEKVVTLNNMFPNGTDSYNWTNDKGVYTCSEIENKGNTVYDEQPILSLTIDPSTASEIKKYNKNHLDDGGYSNKTVSCEAKGGYEEVVCFSEFVDDILNGEYGNIVNDNSLIADDSYRSASSDYFKLWENTIAEDRMIGPAWK